MNISLLNKLFMGAALFAGSAATLSIAAEPADTSGENTVSTPAEDLGTELMMLKSEMERFKHEMEQGNTNTAIMLVTSLYYDDVRKVALVHETLIPLMESKDDTVRAAIAFCWHYMCFNNADLDIGDMAKETQQILINHLKNDPSGKVRVNCITTLAILGGLYDELRAECFEVLINAADDKDPRVRKALPVELEYIGSIHNPAKTLEVLMSLKQDLDPDVARNADFAVQTLIQEHPKLEAAPAGPAIPAP